MRRLLAAATLALAPAFPCLALAGGLPPAARFAAPPTGPAAISQAALDPGAPVDVAELLGDPDATVLSTHRVGGISAMVVEHRTGRYFCQGVAAGPAPAATAPYRCARAEKPYGGGRPGGGMGE